MCEAMCVKDVFTIEPPEFTVIAVTSTQPANKTELVEPFGPVPFPLTAR